MAKKTLNKCVQSQNYINYDMELDFLHSCNWSKTSKNLASSNINEGEK